MHRLLFSVFSACPCIFHYPCLTHTSMHQVHFRAFLVCLVPCIALLFEPLSCAFFACRCIGSVSLHYPRFNRTSVRQAHFCVLPVCPFTRQLHFRTQASMHQLPFRVFSACLSERSLPKAWNCIMCVVRRRTGLKRVEWRVGRCIYTAVWGPMLFRVWAYSLICCWGHVGPVFGSAHQKNTLLLCSRSPQGHKDIGEAKAFKLRG